MKFFRGNTYYVSRYWNNDVKYCNVVCTETVDKNLIGMCQDGRPFDLYDDQFTVIKFIKPKTKAYEIF